MPDHWFEALADHTGRAYLRYAHTRGTVQEVDHLVGALGLAPGQRVLDVGCGPGRHARELAQRGIACHGVDISERFVALARDGAPPGATFERLDARHLPFDAEFDAVLSLCQGAFGLSAADDDQATVAGMSTALRPGARLALTAANAYFVVRHHAAAQLDAATGIAHERTLVHDEAGERREFDLWTGCYTPRELRLLMTACGLAVERVSSVEPGAYGSDPPDLERPELLVIARKPIGQASPA